MAKYKVGKILDFMSRLLGASTANRVLEHAGLKGEQRVVDEEGLEKLGKLLSRILGSAVAKGAMRFTAILDGDLSTSSGSVGDPIIESFIDQESIDSESPKLVDTREAPYTPGRGLLAGLLEFNGTPDQVTKLLIMTSCLPRTTGTYYVLLKGSSDTAKLIIKNTRITAAVYTSPQGVLVGVPAVAKLASLKGIYTLAVLEIGGKQSSRS